MTWQQALDILTEHAHNWRYRELCDHADPEVRDAWRLRVVEKITGGPSLVAKARNVTTAIVTAAASGFALVDDAEQERRLAICRACEWFDPFNVRCRHQQCGCFVRLKTRIESQHCPIEKW